MSWIIGSSGGVTSALTGRARSTKTLSIMLGRYAQPTSPTLRTLSIVLGKYAQPTPPTVDSALAKIRVLYFLHAQTVSPFMLCISRLNVLAPRVSPVRKSAMPNRRPRLRSGNVIKRSGFDGEYGVINLFNPDELVKKIFQI